jgi:acyl transferase domain-containing protein
VESGATYLIALSAKTEEALLRKAEDLLQWLAEEAGDIDLGDMAYTLLLARTHYGERLGLVVHDLDDLRAQLSRFVTGASPRLSAAAGSGVMTEWAAMYVRGMDADWEALYPATQYRRIWLPAYPFARERYWIPTAAGAESGTGPAARLHPLVDANTSTLQEQRFTTQLAGHELWLLDHVVAGQPIFPGAAYLEMARAAGELSGFGRIAAWLDVAWVRPLVFAGQPLEVHVGLYPRDRELDFEIFSSDAADERSVHAQGTLRAAAAMPGRGELPPVDLQAIRRRCPALSDATACYQMFAQAGFDYGPRFRTIRQLWLGEKEALASVALPEEAADTTGSVLLPPALVDGALQTTISLLRTAAGGVQFLPWSVGEVLAVGPATSVAYAYAVLTDTSVEGACTFDVSLVDETGRRLILMEDVVLRGQRAHRAAEAAGQRDDTVLGILARVDRGELNAEEAERLLGGLLHE